MMPQVGVTAWTREDAQLLMRERLFGGEDLPPVSRVIESVNIVDLDEKHVQRHIAPPNARGIWYPVGYQHE